MAKHENLGPGVPQMEASPPTGLEERCNSKGFGWGGLAEGN